MMSIQVYPVLDGVELWVTAHCVNREHTHDFESHEKASCFVEAERLDRAGIEAAVGFELGVMMTEFPLLARLARC